MRYGMFCAAFLAITTWPSAVSASQFDAPLLSVHDVGDGKIALQVNVGPMGAPAGFTIEWIRESDLNASGDWSLAEVASFIGTPTVNAWGAEGSYVYLSQGTAIVEIGDLFDETGVHTTSADELEPGTTFHFRAYVNAYGLTERSAYSETVVASTTSGQDCTHTQGYWKNHEEDWDTVSLELGLVTYTAAELDAIFETPAEGNGSLILAHQLIATLLNVVVLGADLGLIQDAIADAQMLLGTCGLDPIPPHGTCYIDPADASPIAQLLDDFNNSTGDNCGTVSLEPTSWGSVKAGYR